MALHTPVLHLLREIGDEYPAFFLWLDDLWLTVDVYVFRDIAERELHRLFAFVIDLQGASAVGLGRIDVEEIECTSLDAESSTNLVDIVVFDRTTAQYIACNSDLRDMVGFAVIVDAH